MRRLLGLVFLTCALVAAGCGTYVDFTEINRPPHELSPRPTRSVEVFASGPPARRHVDVGIVEAEQTHSLNEQGTGLMVREMRKQAAAMGCDAIVLGGTTDHSGAQPGTGWSLLDPGSTKRQATCIVYDDEPAPRQFARAPLPRVMTSNDEAAAPAPRANRRVHQVADDDEPAGR